jgi:peptide/nickel transport system substrate-binding protein
MVKEKRIHDLCCFDSSPKSTFRVLREKLISKFRGPWWQGYNNQEVNQLFFEATNTFDHEKRRGIYQTIYRIITSDAPWVFMYRPYLHWIIGEKADFWYPGPLGLTKIK